MRVLQCEKEVKRYLKKRQAVLWITKDPKLSLLSLQKTTRHLAMILSINSMNLSMTLHLEEFLIEDSPKKNNIFKALYVIPGLFCKNLHFMCTQIWHSSHCTAWWLFATALLHILHGNLITIINCRKGIL